MNRPVFPWPFPASPRLSTPKPSTSSDAAVDMEPVDEPDEPFCQCGEDPTEDEACGGVCDSCGKELP